MNSFNHYSLGSVGHWLFSAAAGIAPVDGEPAFRRFTIRPRPGGSITEATATHDCASGRIESAWQLEDGAIDLRVVVPWNTEAEVWIPSVPSADLLESGTPAAEAEGITVLGDREGSAVVLVGGGAYAFAGRRRA
jgi:alpha-L-rhamnosidase